MMKKLLYVLSVLILLSCNSEDALDCLQSQGQLTRVVKEVPIFLKIRIEDDVSLVIKQGPVQEVIIETGSYLESDVTVKVEGGTLVIKDNNRCNLVRGYGATTAYVTVPNLTEIRNSSEYDVVADGVLQFPNLSLVSNTTGGIEDTRKSGDFTMTVACEVFVVSANGFSGFYITGSSDVAVIAFEDEVPRFEGANFIVQDMRIFHRSTNKMIVHPLQTLRGQIRGVGDVISVTRPPIIEVEEFFTGRLIFQD